MANFLENVFKQLQRAADRVVLARSSRARSSSALPATNCWSRSRALARIFGSLACNPAIAARFWGPNSIQWAAIDLALMAEGAIVVPLYSRQAAAEFAAMMKDCCAATLVCQRRLTRRSRGAGLAAKLHHDLI